MNASPLPRFRYILIVYSRCRAAFYERLSVPRIPLIERGYILIENHATAYSHM